MGNKVSHLPDFKPLPENCDWARGSFVLITKPANADDDDAWVDAMDKFVGAIGIVVDVHVDEKKRNRFKVCVGHLDVNIRGGLVTMHYKPAWLCAVGGAGSVECVAYTTALEETFVLVADEKTASNTAALIESFHKFAPGDCVAYENRRAVVLSCDESHALVAFVHAYAIDTVQTELIATLPKPTNQPITDFERRLVTTVVDSVIMQAHKSLKKCADIQAIITRNLNRVSETRRALAATTH